MLGSTARAIRSMYVTASSGYSPTAVSPESMTAEVPSRIAFATSLLRACRLGVVDHRLEHLRRGDHRLAALERLRDHALLDERDERRTDLDPEVAARDHHRVALGQHVVEHVDGLRLLDLRDHVRVRAGLLDQHAE